MHNSSVEALTRGVNYHVRMPTIIGGEIPAVCGKGHPLSGENLITGRYSQGRGNRYWRCQECINIQARYGGKDMRRCLQCGNLLTVGAAPARNGARRDAFANGGWLGTSPNGITSPPEPKPRPAEVPPRPAGRTAPIRAITYGVSPRASLAWLPGGNISESGN